MLRARSPLLALLVVAGCEPPPLPPVDTEPPRVIKVEPRGTNVPVETTVKVVFSEPMNRETCTTDTIALIPTALIEEKPELAEEVDNPPINVSARPKFVPARVTVSSDGTVAELSPLWDAIEGRSLQGVTSYTVLVSKKVTDTHGNPLADKHGLNARHQSQFTTSARPDRTAPVPSVDLDQQVNVPLDLAQVVVRWSEPVAVNVAINDAIYLEEGPAQVAVKGAVTRDGALTTWTLALGPRAAADPRPCPDGSAPLAETTLCPDTEYTLVLRGFSDAAGNPTEPERHALFRFRTARCLDRQPPALNAEAVTGVTDGAAVVTWRADERARGQVDYASDEGFDAWTDFAERCSTPNAACGRVVGPLGKLEAASEVDPCLSLEEQRARAGAYAGAVTLDRLAPSTTYHYRITVIDLSGNHALISRSEKKAFSTLAPLPKIAITEVMANPASPQEEGEYIELYNAGAEPVSLAGWSLGRLASTTVYTLVDGSGATDGAAFVIEPGGFTLVAGKAFRRSRFPALPSATAVLHLRSSSGTVSNALFGSGLSASSPPALGLSAPSGVRVSTFADGAAVPTHCKTDVSVERVAAGAPDATGNWSCANGNVPPGHSPGAPNGGWAR